MESCYFLFCVSKQGVLVLSALNNAESELEFANIATTHSRKCSVFSNDGNYALFCLMKHENENIKLDLR